MEPKDTYDLCIVGAGLFGSAAARHASANKNIKVCLIGPEEPKTDECSRRKIFGAHYDEGRITRILAEDPVFVVLNKRSLERYKEIEELSGIHFHKPVGCVIMGVKNGSLIKSFKEAAKLQNVPFTTFSNTDLLQKRFPFFNVTEAENVILDDNGAGHISPRKLVAAQKKIAESQGCHIINSVVSNIKKLSDQMIEVETEAYGAVYAMKVLIATGAFVNMQQFDILKPLKLTRSKHTVALLRVTEAEATRLKSMPSVIAETTEYLNFGIDGIYMLPPIKYPDDQYYIKYGDLTSNPENDFKTLEEMAEWYISDGDEMIPKMLLRLVTELIPGLEFTNYHRSTCITCYTPLGMPYIDQVSPQVTLAIAGNGRCAKSSDEIGRIAAHLSINGEWDSELNREYFKAIFE